MENDERGWPKTPRTLADLAKEALQVQDAVNPLGLSKSYARAVQELRDRLELDGLPCGTDDIRTHSVNQLWVCKLADLARVMAATEEANDAYYKVRKLAEGN